MSVYSAITDAIVTTMARRNRKLADNVLDNNVLTAVLRKRGKVTVVTGGRTIEVEILAPGGSNFKRYAGYEALDTTPVSWFELAEYEWALAAVTVSATGAELRANRGKHQLINLMNGRMQGAKSDLENNIADDVYSDGSADSGKQLKGLDVALPETNNSGTYGGIDRSTNTFWQNYTSGDLSSPSATTIQGFMQTAWLSVIRGAEHPDLIIGKEFAVYFWDSLLANQRLTDPEKGVSGFRSLEFAGPSGFAPVFHDPNCQTNRMYMVNTKYAELQVMDGANFEPLQERVSMNQDAIAIPIIFQGQLVFSNMKRNAVLWT